MQKMAAFSGLLSNFPVLGYNNVNQMLSFQHTSISSNSKNLSTCSFVPKWISSSKMQSFDVTRVSKGGNYGLKFDEYDEDPYLLHLFKESLRGSKVLFDFLIQQPGQLKYIEWPSFNYTFRTATLTLVLVALLIVALSSIDSALSFILALLLRRPA
ncbi:hypothetical protein RND81_11G148600 [Saponaria officinalis]|uniref:Uncharacterized protein n=1 Tax=Saponaria officinalis TaxID=3572 RepID=A0AAW1HM99_SAPOF